MESNLQILKQKIVQHVEEQKIELIEQWGGYRVECRPQQGPWVAFHFYELEKAEAFFTLVGGFDVLD